MLSSQQMTKTATLCCIMIFIFSGQLLSAAELIRRTAKAAKADTEIKIDGKDTGEDWSKADILSGFTQYEPANGLPSAFTTRVRMLFDDEGLYVFADLIDNAPDSISTELGKRDSDNDITVSYTHLRA